VSSSESLLRYGVGVGVGLLVAGYAAQSYLWYGYQKANPATGGGPSTSPGFVPFTAVLFVAGTVLAYVAFARGLGVAVGDG
jgi:multisubunit Na+/H+ antiporter MnhB subunit